MQYYVHYRILSRTMKGQRQGLAKGGVVGEISGMSHTTLRTQIVTYSDFRGEEFVTASLQ